MNKLLHFSLILLIFGTNWSNVNSQLEVGDPCIVQTTRKLGTCVLLQNCSSALLQQRQGKRPTVCGYQNQLRIVCCQHPILPNIDAHISESLYKTIRHEKCVEYSDAVFETNQITLLDGTVHDYKINRCAQQRIPVVAGIQQASPREFPHSAQIGYQETNNSIVWLCGGSLISKSFVVTASHCVTLHYLYIVKFVKLGDLNTATELDDARPEIFNIEEVILHPEYSRPRMKNDIALLRLDREVIFSPYIRPLCLPLVNITTNISVISTGWGTTASGGVSSSLLKVTLDVFTHSECNSIYQMSRRLPQGIIDDTQICAGSRNFNEEICKEAGGGPLQIIHNNVECMYTLIGISSAGSTACGAANTPGIYTSVAAYVDWIEGIVWPAKSTIHFL